MMRADTSARQLTRQEWQNLSPMLLSMTKEEEVGLATVLKRMFVGLTIGCMVAPQKLGTPGYRFSVGPSPLEMEDIANAHSKVGVEVSKEVEASKEVVVSKEGVVLNLEMGIKGLEMNPYVESITMFIQMPETLSLEGFKFNALPSLPSMGGHVLVVCQMSLLMSPEAKMMTSQFVELTTWCMHLLQRLSPGE